MARIPKRKKEQKKPRRDIVSVPLKALEYKSDEEWEEEGVRCDWCGVRDTEGSGDWMVSAGITVDSMLVLAQYCPDCFHNKIEWGRVYCPGGFGTMAIPVGLET